MKKIWPALKWILTVWGALSAIAVGAVLISMRSSLTDSDETASISDVRFVLNWSGLGDHRIQEVTHSFISARSLTGDHLDAHAIKISNIDEGELTKDEFGRGWYRCDSTEGLLSDAIDFAGGWIGNKRIPWFPSREKIESEDMYVYLWSIYCQGTRPTAVEIIFIEPKTKMVYFMSSKT